MLDPIIAFLNDKNREYAEGEADYNWSAWADNCSHAMRNALAAANIWSPLSVRAVKFRQIFNLAIPANEFVNLAELITQGDIDDSISVTLKAAAEASMVATSVVAAGAALGGCDLGRLDLALSRLGTARP
jgi:hypothetical protein